MVGFEGKEREEAIRGKGEIDEECARVRHRSNTYRGDRSTHAHHGVRTFIPAHESALISHLKARALSDSELRKAAVGTTSLSKVLSKLADYYNFFFHKTGGIAYFLRERVGWRSIGNYIRDPGD